MKIYKVKNFHAQWKWKGWALAENLKSGDKVLLYSGNIVKITKLKLRYLKKPVKVYNFEVEEFHTYYVSDIHVLVHNKPMKNNALKKIYTSIKKAPGYNNSFKAASNGLTKHNINNMELLNELNQVGSGWKKVYQNGWIDGKKVSLHYFQDKVGKIFDFKIKWGKWS